MRRSFAANTLPAVLCIALAAALLAQPPKKPFQSQSSSTINYSVLKDGEEIADITNVSYDLTGESIPGRPPAERLVLRKTTHLKQVIGDKGLEAKATVAAWPLGADPVPLNVTATVAFPGSLLLNATLIDGAFPSTRVKARFWSQYDRSSPARSGLSQVISASRMTRSSEA